MNKIQILIVIATLCVSVSLRLEAQPLGEPPVAQASPPASFFDSVKGYFTAFDTNSTTFTADHVEVWGGVDQAPDLLSAVLGATVNLPNHLTADIVFRNASVAGTLVSAQGGVGYSYIKYDVKLTGGVDVGYDFNRNCAFAEPYADARKALTENTYAGLRLYYQQDFSAHTAAHAPGLFIFTGFKF